MSQRAEHLGAALVRLLGTMEKRKRVIEKSQILLRYVSCAQEEVGQRGRIVGAPELIRRSYHRTQVGVGLAQPLGHATGQVVRLDTVRHFGQDFQQDG